MGHIPQLFFSGSRRLRVLFSQNASARGSTEWNRKSSIALKHGTQQFSVNLATIFWSSPRNYHIQNSMFIFKKESTPLQMRRERKRERERGGKEERKKRKKERSSN